MASLVLLVHFIQPQCLLEYIFTGLTFSRPEGHFLLGSGKVPRGCFLSFSFRVQPEFISMAQSTV